MRPYVPGLQPTDAAWVKLNTNENPFPPSPLVRRAIVEDLGAQASVLRKYPNPTSAPLREAIAEHHGVGVSQVLATNGADDGLNLLMRAFTEPGKPGGMTEPSYSLYTVLAAAAHAEMFRVPFNRDFALPVNEISECGANCFFLTSPNSPSGVGFAPEEVAVLAERFPGILVVDETYAPFAGVDCVGLLERFPRLVITRSFSKTFSLAGLRVGYVLAHPAVISLLDRVRDSYNLDRLAQSAAVAALRDTVYYANVIRQTVAERERLGQQYGEWGWRFPKSAANFHLVEPRNAAGASGPGVAQALYDFLEARKILVRIFPQHPLTRSALRISVGGAEENAALLSALSEWRQS